MSSSADEDAASGEDFPSPRWQKPKAKLLLDSEEHFPPLLSGPRDFTPPKIGQSYKSVLVGDVQAAGEAQGPEEADECENDPGPGPQPLRGISGFPTQPASQTRNNPLSSARMPNGKLGMNILERQ